MTTNSQNTRCPWCLAHPLLTDYHDVEWGVPKISDSGQFEHLVLEIFQAGLSWLTILKRRDAFRQVFSGFDPVKVAAFDEMDVARLLNDASIIRNRAKISAAIHNAERFLGVARESGDFFHFVKQFAPPEPHAFSNQSQIPASIPEAEALSRELKRRGFRFAGPTICYAHLQSVGIVNDHITSCRRFEEIEQLRREAGLGPANN